MSDILVINKSALLTIGDITPAIAAINKQVAADFAPLWGVSGTLYVNQAPTYAWQFILQDSIDQAGDLGYHVDTNGVVNAIIDIAACKACGDDWRQCLSHEVHEALVDPLCTRMSPDGTTMVETDDPVEGDYYLVDDIPISNFVTPAYFGFNQSTRYDFMRNLTAPMPAMRPGGYLEMLVNGAWQAKRGEHATGYMAMRPNGRRVLKRVAVLPYMPPSANTL